MKPGEASQLIGIGRSTVTTWTLGEYREYFTPSAQGGDGRARSLTLEDVRVLAYIAEQKRNARPNEEIHADLRRMQASDWRDLPALPEAHAGFASVPVVPTAAADAALSSERRALLREIANLENRVEDLETKLDNERTERDKLLREIGALEKRIGALETENELWRSGRLKPE